MTLLCIGKTGQVATALAERTRAYGTPCICMGRPDTDLQDRASLERAIDSVRPNFVVNAAAYTAVDAAESNRDEAFAINADGAARLAELCAARDLPLLEAYMYRAHPQLERLLERVAAGEIGRPLRTESCFTFFAPEDPSHRLLARELGGGGILDVGGYPCSFALAVARACGEESTPILSDVRGHHGPTGVDVEASCVLHFANGLEGHARVSFEQDLTMRASVVGESGTLSLEHPFMPEGRRDGRRGVVVLEREGELQREEVDADADCFGLEARELARLWSTGERHARWPMVDRTQTLQLAELLDSWRASIPAEVVS